MIADKSLNSRFLGCNFAANVHAAAPQRGRNDHIALPFLPRHLSRALHRQLGLLFFYLSSLKNQRSTFTGLSLYGRGIL